MSQTQVQTTGYTDFSVTNIKLANDAVTAAKIATGAVGNTEIAADAVTADKIATGAVGNTEIANDAVTADKIATGAVGTTEIANNAITPAKLSNPLTLETAKSATGTSIEFTNIPSWVKRITVMMDGVTTTGSTFMIIRIGDSGGIETTGYGSYSIFTSITGSNADDNGTGFLIFSNSTTSQPLSGVLTLNNLSGNTWVSTHEFAKILVDTAVPGGVRGAGSKTLSGTLDRIRITTINGTDTFTGGIINIMYD